MTVIERKTYSILEWFRDVGGLSVAMGKIGNLLLGSFSVFTLKATILTNIYRHMKSLSYAEPEMTDLENKEKLKRHMEWDFEHAQRIQAPGFFASNFSCSRKTKRFKRIMAKASNTVTKELNLVKFLKRQRLNTFATLATLNGGQRFICDKMSQLLIRESSDLDDSTSDDNALMQERMKDVQQYGTRVFSSRDTVDKRLVKIYRAKRKAEDRKRISVDDRKITALQRDLN